VGRGFVLGEVPVSEAPPRPLLTALQPVDLTLLDPHYGTIKDWQDMVAAAHERGMYVMLDHTFST